MFAPSFAGLAVPLNNKLREGRTKQFAPPDEKESAVVASLQKALTDSPSPGLPRSEGMYTFDSDGCGKQIRCVLLQEQEEGINHPFGYWSQTLNYKKEKLSTTHMERLAVVWNVRLLCPYFEGTLFATRTDQEALR